MGKTVSVYPPMKLLNELTDKYEGTIWAAIDDIRIKGGYVNTEHSYISIDWVSELLRFNNMDIKSPEVAHDIITLTPLSAWRKHKQVYKFDDSLKDILSLQIDDLDEMKNIPLSIFKSMPYRCIYVESELEKDMHGFFAYTEETMPMDGVVHTMLTIVFLYKTDINMDYIYLDEEDALKPLIEKANKSYTLIYQELFRKNNIKLNGENYRTYKNELESLVKHEKRTFLIALQLVLYICAKNAEITENPEQAKIYRKSSTGIKDKFTEVRKWDVGIRTGQAIKMIDIKPERMNNDIEDSIRAISDKAGTPKRPHTRKGHWHHFCLVVGVNLSKEN